MKNKVLLKCGKEAEFLGVDEWGHYIFSVIDDEGIDTLMMIPDISSNTLYAVGSSGNKSYKVADRYQIDHDKNKNTPWIDLFMQPRSKELTPYEFVDEYNKSWRVYRL